MNIPMLEPTDIDAAPSVSAPDPVQAPEGPPQRLAPFGLSGVDLIVIVVALLLTLGTVTVLYSPAWTLRFATVVAVAPIGGWAMVGLARRRDGAAMWALGLIVAMFASALASTTPLLSIIGPPGADASVAIYVGVLLLWSLGRGLPARSVVLLEHTVIAGCVLNVAYGAMQILFDVRGGAFNAFPGRASGFLQNPAYFSSVIVGSLGWAGARSLQRKDHLSRVLVVLFAFGVGLSGARIALGLAVVSLVAVAVVVRNREVVVVGIAGTVGVLAGWAMTSTSGTPGASNTIERFASKGTDGRLALWRYDLAAWADRPVLGWGLTRHSSAVQGRYSLAFTRASALDDAGQPWDDPHNIVMLLLVSVGLVGLVLAVGFAVAALRIVRNVPLAAMIILIGATWVTQPASIHSLPLALLLLGAAATRQHIDVDEAARAEPVRRRRLAGAALGVWAAGVVVAVIIPSVQLRHAIIDADMRSAAASARWFPADPGVADAVASLYANHGRDTATGEAAMIEWSRRAVERDPQRPLWRTNLAVRQMLVEDYDAAAAGLAEARRLQPWNVAALDATYYLAILTGDEATRIEVDEALCELLPGSCGDDPRLDLVPSPDA